MFWIRPDLAHLSELGKLARDRQAGSPGKRWLDTAIFDIDGVLIETSRSYRLSVIAATQHLTNHILHAGEMSDASTPQITPDDIVRWKLAGGFNNDWDLTQALTAFCVAREREWRGRPEAARSLAEWAALASEAASQGGGGVAWVRTVVPASALPGADEARWVHDEYYWGAELLQTLYQRAPRYAPAAPGVVRNEETLLEPALLPALRAQGITRFGVITGRVGLEVAYALQSLTPASGLAENLLVEAVAVNVEAPNERAGERLDIPYARSPFGVFVTGGDYVKPDPQALAVALGSLDARAALYIGDTGDDLDLVLRYRTTSASGARAEDAGAWGVPILAVMVADDATAAAYQHRGADITLPHIRALPDALAALRERLI